MKISIRIIFLIIFAILGFQYFTTTTALVEKADLAGQLKTDVLELQKENRTAALAASKLENAYILDNEAQKRGLIESEEIVYLTTPPSSLAVSKR